MVGLTAPLRTVHALRLRRHHLERPAARSELVTVARDTCGIQSQIPSAAELALRARVQGLRREDVTRALEEDRTLVRGWTVRFTVHVIPSEDFLLYARALLPRVARSAKGWNRAGVKTEKIDGIVRSIVKALAEGPLTRQALADRTVSDLGERWRRNLEHSWGGLVVQAGIRGDVCFGPERGNKITFVSREGWLPHLKDYAEEEAGAILLRRYLGAFGPATPQDFAQWAGVPMANVKAMWARAEDDLATVRVDGRDGWMLKEDLRTLRKPMSDRAIRLLPNFDAYLLGHKDKGHLVDAAHYKRVYRKAGWLSPVVLVGGRVAGVWSYRRQASRWRVTVEKFRPLDRAEREGIAAEADDVGRFLGGASELVFGKVTP